MIGIFDASILQQAGKELPRSRSWNLHLFWCKKTGNFLEKVLGTCPEDRRHHRIQEFFFRTESQHTNNKVGIAFNFKLQRLSLESKWAVKLSTLEQSQVAPQETAVEKRTVMHQTQQSIMYGKWAHQTKSPWSMPFNCTVRKFAAISLNKTPLYFDVTNGDLLSAYTYELPHSSENQHYLPNGSELFGWASASLLEFFDCARIPGVQNERKLRSNRY